MFLDETLRPQHQDLNSGNYSYQFLTRIEEDLSSSQQQHHQQQHHQQSHTVDDNDNHLMIMNKTRDMMMRPSTASSSMQQKHPQKHPQKQQQRHRRNSLAAPSTHGSRKKTSSGPGVRPTGASGAGASGAVVVKQQQQQQQQLNNSRDNSAALAKRLREAGNFALAKTNHLISKSKFLDPYRQFQVKRYQWKDLKVGKLLGKGSYCRVSTVQIIIQHQQHQHQQHQQHSSRNRHRSPSKATNNNNGRPDTPAIIGVIPKRVTIREHQHQHRSSSRTRTYAIKYLPQSTILHGDNFYANAADLAMEAYMLSNLSHENIVKLHGLPPGQLPYTFTDPGGLYLIMEKLDGGTLEKRIHEWKKLLQSGGGGGGTFGGGGGSGRHKRHRSILGGGKAVSPTAAYNNNNNSNNIPPAGTGTSSSSKSSSAAASAATTVPLLHERIEIALGVARAMSYLHSLNIVFRDLKPANVGFVMGGSGGGGGYGFSSSFSSSFSRTVKIFDFGMAKEVYADEDYKTTGMVGTLRYMAPEVASRQPYGTSADVYSFAILLWELCALKRPFSHLTDQAHHYEQVVRKHNRPPTNTNTNTTPIITNIVGVGSRRNNNNNNSSSVSGGGGLGSKMLQELLHDMWHPDPDKRPKFDMIVKLLLFESSHGEKPHQSNLMMHLNMMTKQLSDRIAGTDHEMYTPMKGTTCTRRRRASFPPTSGW